MVRLLLALCLSLTALAAPAQERPRTILVLDGSGSMWGQIDGVNKIVIAREVIGALLQDFPPDQELGLTIYGHRRKGDCSDIETVVAPGTGNLDAIAGAVNAINPKGKTPLSAAVIAAAEALRYGEEKATVILVSDGIETCNVDPCAVGRQLEETGVDFTAHVIGFDVAGDPQALAQLQCLAEETGGTFLTAANAGELTEALQAVSEPPAPVPADITLTATSGAGGPRIASGLVWSLNTSLGLPILSGAAEAAPVLPLPPGDYTAIVTRPEDGARAETGFAVTDEAQIVTLILPEPVREFPVTFRATEGAGGPQILDGLVWTATDAGGNPVLVDNADADPTLPLEPGRYSVLVTRAETNSSAEAAFTVADSAQTVTLVLPELPPEPVRVRVHATDGRNGPRITKGLVWDLTGPDGSVLDSEQAGNLDLDLTAGTYIVSVMRPADESFAELRFGVGSVDKTVLLELPEFRPLATLDAPASAPAGSHVAVDWTGPNAKDDYITVAVPDTDGKSWLHYTYTREGSPLNLAMPAAPGSYEIRYVLNDGRKTLASRPIEVTPVTASVSPSGALVAGASIQVDWTGPDYKDDFIAVIPRDGGRWLTYAYTRNGTPLTLDLPSEPGEYDLAYVMQQGDTVLARLAITVTDTAATLAAPKAAGTGATVQVDWTGPDYKNDFIAVIPRDGGRWLTYAYTRDGAPLDLKMPSEPGEYDIAYVMQQDSRILARIPVSVSATTATVTGPASGIAGDAVQVDWTGPDYKDDFIAVVPRGADKWITYTYTREGAPLTLHLPPDPGDYDLVYVMNQDRTILARMPISVTAVAASLSMAGTAPAGAALSVDWTGPDYKSDFIAVVPRGAEKWINYTYTREGTPLDLTMPPEPGAYDVIYLMNQGRRILARAPVTVTAQSYTLSAPATGPAGGSVQVTWTGPDYKSDFIALSAPDMPEGKWLTYSYTREGSPLALDLPADPGRYEIRYVLNQGRLTKATTSIEVTPVDATLTGPASAPAGSDIQVDWTGPGYKGDLLTIAVPGAAPGKQLAYAYADRGNPATLSLPVAPGRYELRYVMAQSGRKVLASMPIELTAVSATLDAPASAPAGTELSLAWTGPAYKGDFIALVDPKARGNIDYFYTNRPSPGTLDLPDAPGDYELRYIFGKGQTVLHSQPLRID